MSEHTKGPWSVRPRPTKGPASIEAPTGRICTFREVNTQAAIYNEEAWANARLIATAPEMLDALHWAITAVDRLAEVTPSGVLRSGIRTKADEIRTIIAKAEGREP